MKVLIKESRRDQLAIKELDKAFSNMYCPCFWYAFTDSP